MVEIRLSPPTPGMTGRELEQWNQRMYDALVAVVAEADGITVISDHNDLENNGGDNSHASITAHINSERAHGTSSPIVGEADDQELYNKVINGDNNDLSNLRHGEEVDNPTKAHGVEEVAGVTDQQRFENKTELEPYLAVSANYTLRPVDKRIKVILTATITMPTAVGVAGQVYYIENATQGDINVLPKSGQLISDETSQLILPGNTMGIYSDGIGWRFT